MQKYKNMELGMKDRVIKLKIIVKILGTSLFSLFKKLLNIVLL